MTNDPARHGLGLVFYGDVIMVTFELQEGAELSPEEKAALENAKKLPVVYDEDSPELTEAMEQAFIQARRGKCGKGIRRS